MYLVLGFSHHTGIRLGEVAALLILIAGAWLVAALPRFKYSTARGVVAGVALAVGGLLLIIAIHWGHFG